MLRKIFKEKNLNSSILVRIVYSNNFQNTGSSKQFLQIFSMSSNVILNDGNILLNDELIKISSLPISNVDFDIIQATGDYLYIKGAKSNVN